jgi:hypothetical protein
MKAYETLHKVANSGGYFGTTYEMEMRHELERRMSRISIDKVLRKE